mmetsp:Transcript_3248/g.8366  ORF Transcript_3248/g.8366 Transcript_3248/m.8366 type:complete len:299 (+) Transcript_3248:847-1743(+)
MRASARMASTRSHGQSGRSCRARMKTRIGEPLSAMARATADPPVGALMPTTTTATTKEAAATMAFTSIQHYVGHWVLVLPVPSGVPPTACWTTMGFQMTIWTSTPWTPICLPVATRRGSATTDTRSTRAPAESSTAQVTAPLLLDEDRPLLCPVLRRCGTAAATPPWAMSILLGAQGRRARGAGVASDQTRSEGRFPLGRRSPAAAGARGTMARDQTRSEDRIPLGRRTARKATLEEGRPCDSAKQELHRVSRHDVGSPIRAGQRRRRSRRGACHLPRPLSAAVPAQTACSHGAFGVE